MTVMYEDDGDDDKNSLFTPAALHKKVTLGGEVGEPRALRVLAAKLLQANFESRWRRKKLLQGNFHSLEA